MPQTQRLAPNKMEEVRDAIVDGYNKQELRAALRYTFGIKLDDYVDVNQGFIAVVDELLAWTEAKYKTIDLVGLLYQRNSGNPRLQAVAQELGSIIAPEPRPANLEAVVNRHSQFVNVAEFLRNFEAMAERVCCVETPYRNGTGFLVGADLVMTNYHVVLEVVREPKVQNLVNFRFDHQQRVPGQQPSGTVCKLQPNGILASSPFDESDITGAGEAEPDKLDYALLKIDRALGNEKGPSGKARGWYLPAIDGPVVARLDYVVIPQHPLGGALQAAWGIAQGFNAENTRILYDTSTEEGSSGSPCLTIDLELFGLHHATRPQGGQSHNRAVPMRLIGADLEQKNILGPTGNG